MFHGFNEAALTRTAGRPPWSAKVFIDPQDNMVGLRRVFFEDPRTYVPKPHPTTGKIESWGVNNEEAEEDQAGMHAWLMRRMMTQTLYGHFSEHKRETPELQFVQVLMERKKEKLSHLNMEELSKRDYILKVTMPKIIDQFGNLLITRRVRVSGGMTLSTFQDKVLTGLMGWCRNYHGYYFTDFTDGSQFGPEKSGAVDMMHLCMNGYAFIPDHEYMLSHVLRAPGDELGYHYDLGDNFTHDIVVESILPAEESNFRVEVLGGHGACPGEDKHGNQQWDENFVQPYFKAKEAGKQRIRAKVAKECLNYQGLGVEKDWDPCFFDVERAKKVIVDAIKSKASVRSGAKVVTIPIGDPFGDNIRTPTKRGEKAVRTPLEKGSRSFMHEIVTKRTDVATQALCAECGKPNPTGKELMGCSGCRKIWYCGRDCQRKNWGDHKEDCRATQEVKKARQAAKEVEASPLHAGR